VLASYFKKYMKNIPSQRTLPQPLRTVGAGRTVLVGLLVAWRLAYWIESKKIKKINNDNKCNYTGEMLSFFG